MNKKIPFELVKQLKDAGFPQEFKLGTWACVHGLESMMEKHCDCSGDDLFYAPTLSELIDACGDELFMLITELFHNTYERLAPDFGYETREDTKKFDPDSKNGKLMIATVTEVLKHMIDEGAVAKLWLKLNEKK